MPGRHVTDHQVRLYMSFRRSDSPALAAAKAGFSTATAYRFEQEPPTNAVEQPPRGRRRPDPLAGIFDEEIVPLLEAAPGLRPVALFEELRLRSVNPPDEVTRTSTSSKSWVRRFGNGRSSARSASIRGRIRALRRLRSSSMNCR